MKGLESESPACTVRWVVVPFPVIGNSGKGASLEETLVSDQNGAIKEVFYVRI